MDRKTLEYMEERANKARSIVVKIERLFDEINRAKKVFSMTLEVHGDKDINIGPRDYSEQPNTYRTELAATMNNVFIEMALQEIRRLESELAEL